MAASLKRTGTTIEVATPYDPSFVERLKAEIPTASRTWRRPVWVVDANYFDIVHALCVDAFGTAKVMDDPTISVQPETRKVLIEYLARVKDDGYALGWANGGWTIRFSEASLREFFEEIWSGGNGNQAPTLYAVLGIKRDAVGGEIMRAYRRAAFTWHPDRCAEPDAKERFIQIKHAFDTLSDPTMRAKYDAGLRLEQGVVAPRDLRPHRTMSQLGYAPPVRCGRVTCTGVQGVRFNVEQIHAWDDDILQVAYLKLIRIAYWPAGAKTFETRWEVL